MDTTVQTRVYWIVRFWCPRSDKNFYVYDTRRYNGKADWDAVEDKKKAHRFENRSAARRVTKSASFDHWLLGRYKDYAWRSKDREPPTHYWEILKVVETITSEFQVESVDSNIPDMVQIARTIKESS